MSDIDLCKEVNQQIADEWYRKHLAYQSLYGHIREDFCECPKSHKPESRWYYSRVYCPKCRHKINPKGNAGS